MELKRTDRRFEDLDSVDNILKLLEQHKTNLRLYIKNYLKKEILQITNIADDKTITIVADPGYVPENDHITVYGLLDKYFM